MTLSAKTCFFVVVTALAASAQTTFAGGRIGGGGGGGNFSRPAVRPPATVNRSLSARSPGNVKALNPTKGVQNGNASGVVRSSQPGNGNASGTNPNSSKITAQTHHDDTNSNRVPALPNRVPATPDRVPANSNRVAPTNGTDPSTTDAPPSQSNVSVPAPHATTPSVPSEGSVPHLNLNDVISPANPIRGRHHIDPPASSPPATSGTGVKDKDPLPGGGGSTVNPGSGSKSPLPPQPSAGDHKHVDPLPGERPIAVPPPSPGITNPGNGAGSGGNIGDILGNLSSLLSGAGGSSGATGGADGAAPVEVPATAAASDPVATSPAQTTETQTKDVLDVELTAVRLVEEGSLERKVGPRYRLYYRNAGTVEAPKFHVSVAVDIGEKLTEKAELVTVEAVGLKPGKSQTVDVRLPVEVLKMAIDYEGRPAAFNAFVALIDSDNDLAETNEQNNFLVFSRDKIQSVK